MGKFGVLAVIGVLILTFTGTASAQIAGSAHDFRNRAQITAVTGQGNEICKACHVPHNSVTTVGKASVVTYDVTGILWAKDYGTPTSFSGQSLKVRNSVLCMGCHDGTMADAATGKYVYFGKNGMNIGNDPGNDLSNDHPVDLVYSWLDSQKPWAKTEFVDPAQIAPLPLYSGLDGSQNNVACQTCHDVHGVKNPNDPYGYDIAYFLRVDNFQKSALCFKCHVK